MVSVRINAVLRDCAQQKNEYQDYKNGMWFPKTEVVEAYEEGCTIYDREGKSVVNKCV